MNNSKQRHPIRRVVLIWTLLSLVVIVVMFISFVAPTQYTEMVDIADYGIFTGTNSDSFTQMYINSFFPVELDPSFDVISYSYRAENNDSYGFEAYLEFRIDDTETFDEYIQTLDVYGEPTEFPYDYTFVEYNIEDGFDLSSVPHPSIDAYPIEYARVRKILYSTETQTIIYIAIGVYDGGGVDTSYLCTFFERFCIDPRVYEQVSDSPYGCDPFSIE